MGENKYKSDVFILGIILLQCSLLENMDSLYNYSTGTINILILEHAITELKKKKFSF